jgi:hypothetical protein
VVEGGGLLLLVGAGALLYDDEGELLLLLLLLLGELVDGVAVVVTGAACVVAEVVTGWAAVVWVFFLWWTFFLWCFLAFLWCVVVVLVVSAARCCLDLWVLDDPPQPATATAAATVITSTRFIAPLRSREDVDSGAAIVAQIFRRFARCVARSSSPATCRRTARRIAAKSGNINTIWSGLLEGALAGHGGNC